MIAERGRGSEKIQRVGDSRTVGGAVLGVRDFLGSYGGGDRFTVDPGLSDLLSMAVHL